MKLFTYGVFVLSACGAFGCSSSDSSHSASSAGANNAGANSVDSVAGSSSSTGGSSGSSSSGMVMDMGMGGELTTPMGSKPSAMPIISHGVPAFGSPTDPASSAGNANDRDPATYWLSKGIPATLAYDLSSVPVDQRQEVLVAWYDGMAEDFINPTVDASKHWPIDYTLEINTAAGGGNPPTDGWTVVETVTGNDRNAHQRLVALNGANWVRMNVTKSSDAKSVGFDMDVHSAPDGASDAWLFMGDSITFISSPYLFSDLPALVNMTDPSRWPAIIPAGIGGTNTQTALSAIADTMSGFPGRFVVLGYGTNDDPTNYHMEELVQAVIAAGKVPVVPHMPWSDSASIQSAAMVINQAIDALYVKYPVILHGPDFYTVFNGRTDLIPSGDVHPNAAGQEVWRKQWAMAMTQ